MEKFSSPHANFGPPHLQGNSLTYLMFINVLYLNDPKITEILERCWVPKLSQVYNYSSNQEYFDLEIMPWPMIKALNSQSLGLEFKTTGWLQG